MQPNPNKISLTRMSKSWLIVALIALSSCSPHVEDRQVLSLKIFSVREIVSDPPIESSESFDVYGYLLKKNDTYYLYEDLILWATLPHSKAILELN